MEIYDWGQGKNKSIYPKHNLEDIFALSEEQKFLREIEVIYKKISHKIFELENKEQITEYNFKNISNAVDQYVRQIKTCLDYLWWPPKELDKFQSMYAYYIDVRSDVMFFLLEKEDMSAQDYRIQNQLNKLFENLSNMIMEIESNKSKKINYQNIKNILKAIVDKLQVWLQQGEISKSEYDQWMLKYDEIKKYIRGI